MKKEKLVLTLHRILFAATLFAGAAYGTGSFGDTIVNVWGGVQVLVAFCYACAISVQSKSFKRLCLGATLLLQIPPIVCWMAYWGHEFQVLIAVTIRVGAWGIVFHALTLALSASLLRFEEKPSP